MNEHLKIYESESYRSQLKELALLERDREFCRHDIFHFLSVARISVILCNRRKIKISEDLLYSAALMHDLGRIDEIKFGISHEIASVERAKKLLSPTLFSEEEKALISKLILNHRKYTPDILLSTFHEADIISRPCGFCEVREKCKWSEEKKNHILI